MTTRVHRCLLPLRAVTRRHENYMPAIAALLAYSGMSHTAEHPPAAACGGQCLGIVRRRSSRTVACGSSPVGNPGRCQCPLRKKDEASTCSCLGVGVRTIYLSNARPKARTRRRRLARIGLPGTCATGASRARRRNRVRPRVHATLRHSGGRSWR